MDAPLVTTCTHAPDLQLNIKILQQLVEMILTTLHEQHVAVYTSIHTGIYTPPPKLCPQTGAIQGQTLRAGPQCAVGATADAIDRNPRAAADSSVYPKSGPSGTRWGGRLAARGGAQRPRPPASEAAATGLRRALRFTGGGQGSGAVDPPAAAAATLPRQARISQRRMHQSGRCLSAQSRGGAAALTPAARRRPRSTSRSAAPARARRRPAPCRRPGPA